MYGANTRLNGSYNNLFTTATATVKVYGNKTSSFELETESASNGESIIEPSSKFPVISEEKEIMPNNLDEKERKKNESTFRPAAVEHKCIIEVNPGATDNN